MTDYLYTIKLLREKRKFKQEYMAEKLHISQRAYSSIENGQTALTVDRLYKIAEILKVRIMDILSGNEDDQSDEHEVFKDCPLKKQTDSLNELNSSIIRELYIDQKSIYEKIIRSKDDKIAILKSIIDEYRERNKHQN